MSRLVPACSLAAAVTLALSTSGLAAEEAAADWEIDTRILDRISITGSRDDVREIPGSAHVIGEDELDQTGYADPHRILRSVPGVYIHEEEGFGLFPHVSIRGSRLERAGRITLMEDGVLAAPAPYSAPAAYVSPNMGRMRQVEVRKGSSAIQYGPYTTSGAINMLTAPVPESFQADAQLLFGSHGGSRHSVTVGDRQGSLGWLLEGWESGSDGFKQLDVPQRQDNRMPDPNTGFEQQDLMGKLQFRPNGTDRYQEWELSFSTQDRTIDDTYLGLTQEDFQGQPYRRYSGSAQDEINTEHRKVALTHFIELGNADFTTTLYDHDTARNWYKLHEVWDGQGQPDYVGISSILDDPDSHAGEMDWIRGSGGDARGNVRANNRSYYSRGIQTTLSSRFNTGEWSHQLEVGLRYHQDEEDRLQWQDSYSNENHMLRLLAPGSDPGIESGIPGSTTNRVTEATALAFHVQNRMRRGDWTLIPGVRFEDIEIERTDFREGDNPSREEITSQRKGEYSVVMPGFGAVYRHSPQLSSFLGIHRGFSPSGASPGVDEERSMNYETGLRYQNNGLSLELIGFLTAFENMVGTCTAASGADCEVGEQFNGGEVDVLGLEVLGRYDLARLSDTRLSLPLEVAYTRTEAEFKESFVSGFSEWGDVQRGDELPQIPSDQLNISLSVISGDWLLRAGANYVAETRATAGSGPIPDEDRIDDRWLFDISGEYRVADSVRLFGSVENLSDETYVAARRPAGLRPGMPRTVWAGVKLDF
ncbi:Fe(3+) dicitrate transport protein [Natronospira proteinivora]|uniref:Fe(3+) dicitrate transport protein n=1 Tax=Natronospira proteinivora TaxID=1807133 RepID=A0ABT1GAZ6_9GAMM|nr:TonB-dependent receptor [Natronospira proteinivora]MCP1728477.1 Fe(3+) dicitrate transport protein [Natronospira proteinivora]